MTDPLRSDRLPVVADVPERDRDARIEELLLAGLDHYFSEQHELAINVWTRVLFIDRGHARARAYIERARSAIAERQRKGDELLHTGVAALDRGDAGAARELVASAVEHGAPGDEAMALLARIERLERAAMTFAPAQNRTAAAAGRSVELPPVRARATWIAAGLAAGAVLGAAVLALLVQRGVIGWPLDPRADPLAGSELSSPLPLPTPAELALTRARALHGRGRLHEAITVLETVSYGDPVRPRADALKTAVQRQLLGLPAEA